MAYYTNVPALTGEGNVTSGEIGGAGVVSGEATQNSPQEDTFTSIFGDTALGRHTSDAADQQFSLQEDQAIRDVVSAHT